MFGRLLTITASSALLLAGIAGPAAAVDETWVSGMGDDANPCTRTAPCKTYAGAISKTTAGGVIRVLDPGGFGALTITKAITIDASPLMGSTLATSTNGIIVNAGLNDKVVLRGLHITGGQNTGPCGPTLINGIRVLSAGSVQIENTRIALASGDGILVAPTVNPAKVTVVGSQIRNGCGAGVRVAPTAGVPASVNVVDSAITLNAVGIVTEAGATVGLQQTTLYGNGAATQVNGGSIDTTDPGNHIVANDPISAPTIPVPPVSATRTWVSGTGNDANPCSRTSPCKTLAGAFSKTSRGGEINVLDGATPGVLTINKAMTIDATGASTQIQAAGGSAITVDVSASEAVVLRGLNILGTDNTGPGCSYAAATGVRVLNGRSVHIENSTISGFTGAGVDILPSASDTRVVIDHSVISNSCTAGIRVTPAGGRTGQAFIRASSLVNNGTALVAAGGGSIWAADSYLAGNGTTSSGAGSITIFPGTVEVPKEVIKEVQVPVQVPAPVTPVAQQPVSCKALPKALKRKRTTVLLTNTCVTTAGQKVTVGVTGAGRLVKGRFGKVSVKTKKKGKVTVTLSASATPAFLAFSSSRTYQL
jgi:hypothetical protein